MSGRFPMSDYFWDLDGDFLFIMDLSLGGVSVTNDVEGVIDDLAGMLPIVDYKIVYPDSDMVWDGIETKDGKFVRFLPLHATTYGDAKALLVVATAVLAEKLQDD